MMIRLVNSKPKYFYGWPEHSQLSLSFTAKVSTVFEERPEIDLIPLILLFCYAVL